MFCLSSYDTGIHLKSKLSYFPIGPTMNKEEESHKTSQKHIKGVFDCLTFSEGQGGICFKPEAEQNEGSCRRSTREVYHLHAAFQREVMSQVEQMLQLYSYTSLRSHLLEERWHPVTIDGREKQTSF